MAEQEKLPPGWVWGVTSLRGLPSATLDGVGYFGSRAAESAWLEWLGPNISRLQWETMQRASQMVLSMVEGEWDAADMEWEAKEMADALRDALEES